LRHRHRLRRKRAAELTPLIDVLFIVLFAALIQARGSRAQPAQPDNSTGDAGIADAPVDAGIPRGDTDAGTPDSGVPDSGVADATTGHVRRSREITWVVAGAMRYRAVYIAYVARGGELVSLEYWLDGTRRRRDEVHRMLVEAVVQDTAADGIRYIGDIRPEWRMCRIIKGQFAPDVPSLPALILVITDAPLGEFALDFRDGLVADTQDCYADAGAIAVIIDPTAAEFLPEAIDVAPFSHSLPDRSDQ